MLTLTIASKLYNQLLVNGGFSYSVSTGKYPSDGYSISTYKALENTFNINELTYADIWLFGLKNHRILAKHNTYLGGWYHEGQVYLDISVVVQDQDQAIALAIEHEQLAIYSLHDSIEITV